MSKYTKWVYGVSAVAIWIATVGLFAMVSAAPYGSGSYSNCAYQTSCPVATPPASSPALTPSVGSPTPDTNPAPGTVSSDIDKDGNPESAIDTDGNLGNGYETFSDPDGSSKSLATTDGEQDGKKDFILDINNDGTPDVYWSPDNQYTSTVTVQASETEVAWLFTNANGQVESYVAERKTFNVPQSPGSTFQPVAHERRLTPDAFGGAVYEKIGKIAQEVPKPVAYSFPYLLLALIGLLIARLIFQTKRELHRISMIKAAAVREQQLELEKQNFLMLASHYLRTPITIIKGNIELAESLKSLPDTAIGNLKTVVAGLQTEINNLLGTLSENKTLTQVSQAPIVSSPTKRSWFSPYVIGPLVGVVALLVFANILFIDFKVIQPKFIDFLVQILLVGILGQWFISSFRKRHLHKEELANEQILLDQQRALDAARAEFITKATQGLSGHMATFGQQLDSLSAAGQDTSRIRVGYEQLSGVMRKFMLAVGLQAPSVEANKQQLDNTQVVQGLVGREQPKAAEKNLQLSSTADGGSIIQNQQLTNMVLDSLVDNAIKYSPDNNVVTINQQNERSQTVFNVSDNGPGMSQEQLNLLFKPFSRTESAETFNTEGLGFSLYLSRLIAHYLGGEVSVNSAQGKGTQATFSLPQV